MPDDFSAEWSESAKQWREERDREGNIVPLKRAEQKDQGRPALEVQFGAEALTPRSTGTIVQGVLHEGSLTLVYGPPKSGKSFLATDMFASIAAGDERWMNRPISLHGPVLYVTCEGHAGFWKRLVALTAHRKWQKFPDTFALAIGRPKLIAFDKRNLALPRAEDIVRAVETVEQRIGLPPIAVAIDTVFRSFAPGNVNSSDHMMAYVESVQQVIDKGPAGLLIHHSIKSAQTPAGSISLTGASDTVVYTESRDDGSKSWEIEMAKDDQQTEPRKFRLEIVDIGHDQDGQPASSCVVVDLEETAVRSRGRPKKTAERDLLMRLLHETIDSQGQIPGPGVPPSVAKVANVDSWRAVYMQRNRPDDTDQIKRQAFRRMVVDLQTSNKVGVANKQVWPVHDAS